MTEEGIFRGSQRIQLKGVFRLTVRGKESFVRRLYQGSNSAGDSVMK